MKTIFKILLILIMFQIASFSIVFSQNVSICDTIYPADASALLDIFDEESGFLIPRIALVQYDNETPLVSPANSLLVYNTANVNDSLHKGFYFWNAGNWNLLFAHDSVDWKLKGNNGSLVGSDYLGTSDNQDLDFIVNDTLKLKITKNGRIELLNTGNSIFIGEKAGENDDLQNNGNVFIGNNAGANFNNKKYNLAIGDSAQAQSNTEIFNTSVGHSALKNIHNGVYNNAIGWHAMIDNVYGNRNIAFGNSTLLNLESGYENIAIGVNSISRISNSYENIAIGDSALSNSSDSPNNIAIGNYVLCSQSRSEYFTGALLSNLAIGDSALFNNNLSHGQNESYANTAIGVNAQVSNDKGYANTSIGHNSILRNIDGNNNTCFGSETLGASSWSATYSENNTSMGYQSLFNDFYENNTAIGMMALNYAYGGNGNTSTGSLSMYHSDCLYNTSFGFAALYHNGFDELHPIQDSTNNNTAIGSEAMLGSDWNFLYASDQAYNNTAIGFQAQNAASEWTSKLHDNTSFGCEAFANPNEGGESNVSIGYQALNLTESDGFNTAIGYKALYEDNEVNTAENNTEIGHAFADTIHTNIGNIRVRDNYVHYFYLNDTLNQHIVIDNSIEVLYASVAIGYRALNVVWGFADSTYKYNLAIGHFAIENNDHDNYYTKEILYNTVIGNYVLNKTISGKYNTGFGNNALYNNTRGDNNTVNGINALYLNTTASHNIAIGNYAIYSQDYSNGDSIYSSYNIAVGDSALYSNNPFLSTNGIKNTAIGASALKNNIVGYSNSSLGYQTLYSNLSGCINTVVGYQAMFSNISGSKNNAFGYKSLRANSIGNSNSAFGYQSLLANTSGSNNSAVGYFSSCYSTTGSNNSAYGYTAFLQNTSGANNLMIGTEASWFNTLGNNNIAIGMQTFMKNTSASNNIAIGNLALYSQSYSNSATAWSSNNIAIGDSALFSNQPTTTSVGIGNTAIGYSSLKSNTTGYKNTTIGFQSLYTNVSGYGNIALGDSPLFSNISGANNIAVGYRALYDSDNSAFNISLGYNALENLSGGIYNIGIGSYTLSDIITHSCNIALGGSSGSFLHPSTQYSIYLGYDADAINTISTYNYSVAIGQRSRVSAAQQVRIGNGTSNPATSIGGPVTWTSVSDARFKINIQENVPGIDFISNLRAVTYNFDNEKLNDFYNTPDSCRDRVSSTKDLQIIRTGFIAQEVEIAAKECEYDFSGIDKPKNDNDIYGLRYATFVVPLVQATQEQQDILDEHQLMLEASQYKLEEIRKQNIEIINRLTLVEQNQ